MALTPKRLFLSLCISISLLRSYTFFSRSPLVSKTLFATTTLTPALNADKHSTKKFFVFLVASAIEASSRRKTVSFTSSIPLESDKKNAHGQRRAISVRCTSFHSETGLGLWLKRKPFPHLRTEARSKRTGECRLKPGEGRLKRLRDRPRSEKAIPASAIRSTEQTKPGEC